jgi:ferredoxin
MTFMVGNGYVATLLSIRRIGKSSVYRMVLKHKSCQLIGLGPSIVTARRCNRCTNCHQKCPKDVIDRACYFAEAAEQKLYGLEMRQANLLKWTREDSHV